MRLIRSVNCLCLRLRQIEVSKLLRRVRNISRLVDLVKMTSVPLDKATGRDAWSDYSVNCFGGKLLRAFE